MEVPHGASSRFVTSHRVFVVFPLCFFNICTPLTPVFSRFARRRQDLEGRARDRYDGLDQLDAELCWYRG
jgi:hypothetical protein